MVCSDDERVTFLAKNQTWQLSARRKSLSGRWVFRLKKDEQGEKLKQKSCKIAKGFVQLFGSGCSESVSRKAKLSSFRIFSALATHFCLGVFPQWC